MRFMEGDFPALEGTDLVCIRVNAGDLMTQVSQAGPGGQSDIACSKDCNVHKFLFYDR
jgi:hypothetical protein